MPAPASLSAVLLPMPHSSLTGLAPIVEIHVSQVIFAMPRRLAAAMRLRHQIAHGVNPRPSVHNQYSSPLPDFFRRLGRATDDAVRNHLVNVIGLVNPWPP